MAENWRKKLYPDYKKKKPRKPKIHPRDIAPEDKYKERNREAQKELDRIDAEEAARTPIGGWDSDLSRSEALKIAKSDWAKKQGKTQAPLANLLTIGSAAAAATAAAPGAAASLGKGLAKDWANRTLSDAAYAKFQKTGKMPKGLKGWRPLKAGSWKQLKTGATVQAERLLQGLGIQGGITASPTFAK